MASFIAEMLSTKTRGITVAMGFREDTAGINYDITNNKKQLKEKICLVWED